MLRFEELTVPVALSIVVCLWSRGLKLGEELVDARYRSLLQAPARRADEETVNLQSEVEPVSQAAGESSACVRWKNVRRRARLRGWPGDPETRTFETCAIRISARGEEKKRHAINISRR